MDLSIIIVNWNSKAFLKKCLDSIFANPPGVSFEVVVLDAGSFDGCEQMVREEYPRVRFFQSATNPGFAGSNNLAFGQAIGEHALFLNPDTEVVGGAIGTLYSRFRTLERPGVVGARLLNTDGSLQTSCVQSMPTITNKLLDSEFLRRKWPKSKLWGMAALFGDGIEPSEVDAVSGACLMIRADLFRQVGGFSEDYFMYAEDIDLAYKVRQAGCRNYHVPDAVVVHHGGNSSAHAPSTFASVMTREATLRYFRKTRGPAYAALFRGGVCVAALVRLTLLAVRELLRVRVHAAKSSRTKWHALLRWSLYQDALVRDYYRLNSRGPGVARDEQ